MKKNHFKLNKKLVENLLLYLKSVKNDEETSEFSLKTSAKLTKNNGN